MRATLLLRLSGPMQAWGIDSRFDERQTLREPTKSGVIGLLCAALGKPRDERHAEGLPRLTDLAELQMGVRVDHEGRLAVDYHTAGGVHRRGDRYGVRTASDKPGATVVSQRYYLAEADFLVGLEGDADLLRRIGAALVTPVWQLSLGRKSFLPGVPVYLPAAVAGSDGVVEESLEHALGHIGWTAGGDSPRRAVFEVPFGEDVETRQDVPLDFAARRFGTRYVAVRFIARGEG